MAAVWRLLGNGMSQGAPFSRPLDLLVPKPFAYGAQSRGRMGGGTDAAELMEGISAPTVSHHPRKPQQEY